MEAIHLSVYYNQSMDCLFPFSSSVVSPYTVPFKGNSLVYSLSSLHITDCKTDWSPNSVSSCSKKTIPVHWHYKHVNHSPHLCSRATPSESSSFPMLPQQSLYRQLMQVLQCKINKRKSRSHKLHSSSFQICGIWDLHILFTLF